MRTDVAIVGGGPAGLAAAIGAARRGLGVVVLEKRGWPHDKACGEGLMPPAVASLERLGARGYLGPGDFATIRGMRYVEADGTSAEARFPGTGGMCVRRPVLAAALGRRARELGVDLRTHTLVRGHRLDGERVSLDVEGGAIEARLVIGADGLASPLRRAAGLEMPARGPRRFGLRQHFHLPAWTPFVEVHFSERIEAYVAPHGADRLGVTFLWEDGSIEQPVSFSRLLARFPQLQARLAEARPDSEPRGAGPLLRRARGCTADRLVLVGDAGGYVDAITGEGLSLAFYCAEVLSAILPEALARGATQKALRVYERAFVRAYRRYSLLTHGLLALSRRPRLRHRVIAMLGPRPRLFEAILAWVTKAHTFDDSLAATDERVAI